MEFLPDWHIFMQFAVASIILTFIPGPDMALFVGRSIAQGRIAGFACITGCSVGILTQVFFVALGLSALVLASANAFLMLKIAGALYLLFLAFQALRNKSNFQIEQTKRKPQSFKRNLLTGLMINLLNPKVLLFNITFLPQFISATDPHAGAKIFILGLSFIPISLPFTIFMVLAAEQFAKVLKQNPLYQRILNWLLAGIFTSFALKLLWVSRK